MFNKFGYASSHTSRDLAVHTDKHQYFNSEQEYIRLVGYFLPVTCICTSSVYPMGKEHKIIQVNLRYGKSRTKTEFAKLETAEKPLES